MLRRHAQQCSSSFANFWSHASMPARCVSSRAAASSARCVSSRAAASSARCSASQLAASSARRSASRAFSFQRKTDYSCYAPVREPLQSLPGVSSADALGGFSRLLLYAFAPWPWPLLLPFLLPFSATTERGSISLVARPQVNR